tara:strand:+ start:1263 stop:1676 length:414 start_codon:yes stop_codon:yes gene_type:complete
VSPIEDIGNQLDMVAPPVPPPNIDPIDDSIVPTQPPMQPPMQPPQQLQQRQQQYNPYQYLAQQFQAYNQQPRYNNSPFGLGSYGGYGMSRASNYGMMPMFGGYGMSPMMGYGGGYGGGFNNSPFSGGLMSLFSGYMR